MPPDWHPLSPALPETPSCGSPPALLHPLALGQEPCAWRALQPGIPCCPSHQPQWGAEGGTGGWARLETQDVASAGNKVLEDTVGEDGVGP